MRRVRWWGRWGFGVEAVFTKISMWHNCATRKRPHFGSRPHNLLSFFPRSTTPTRQSSSILSTSSHLHQRIRTVEHIERGRLDSVRSSTQSEIQVGDWCRLWSRLDFADQSLKNCVNIFTSVSSKCGNRMMGTMSMLVLSSCPLVLSSEHSLECDI